MANKKSFELAYDCGPIAKKMHKDNVSRIKLLIGPVGTGKTTTGGFEFIMRQARNILPDVDGVKVSRFGIIRNTVPQLRDTTIKTMHEWFPPGVFGTYNKTDKRWNIKLADGDDKLDIEILFRALDIEQDIRNLLSLEYTALWFDEAREIKLSIFDNAMSRTRRWPAKKNYNFMKETNPKLRTKKGWAEFSPLTTSFQCLLTTNYPSREHWLYKNFVSEKKEGYEIYEQDQAENLHNLPDPKYYENLALQFADRPDLLRTLVLGEWGVVTQGKQVYTTFNRRFHVAATRLLPLVKRGLANGGKIIRGWDNTGLSPACIITYINSLGQWFLFKEFCGEDISIIDFAETVVRWCGTNLPARTSYRDIGDPAGKIRDTIKMSAAQYIKQETGITIEDGIQTFKVRKECVEKRLSKHIAGNAAMVVDPGCIRTIDGFEGGYAYPEVGSTGTFRADPQKNEYSHIHDAIQYPATKIFRSNKGDHFRDEDLIPDHAGE